MLRVYKCQQIDKNENEEKQGLNKYIGDDYILFLTPPQKDSNCLSILGERKKTESTSYIYQKTTSKRNTNFVLKFPGRGGLKPKKKLYNSYLKETLEIQSAFIIFGITKYYHLYR